MTSRQPHEPRVGIFWLRNGKLITDFTPVSEAIAIRLGLGHAAGHIEYWTALQERGVISIESNMKSLLVAGWDTTQRKRSSRCSPAYAPYGYPPVVYPANVVVGVGYPRPYAYRYGGWRGREWRRDHDWRR